MHRIFHLFVHLHLIVLFLQTLWASTFWISFSATTGSSPLAISYLLSYFDAAPSTAATAGTLLYGSTTAPRSLACCILFEASTASAVLFYLHCMCFSNTFESGSSHQHNCSASCALRYLLRCHSAALSLFNST